MKIFIDPGHGGSEAGAVANGIIEKDINLTVALKLKEYLLQYNDVEVMLSRETDIYVDLSERCNMANDWKADYFISVHHNASGSGEAQGYEVIHSIYAGQGKALAEVIAQYFSDLGQKCHGIYSRKGMNGDYYAVIRQTNMPAIITEYAFIDNEQDAKKVDTNEELYTEAKAINAGCVEFLYLNPIEVIPEHWAKQDNDELLACGILLSDHTPQLDEVASEGMVIALVNRLRKYLESSK